MARVTGGLRIGELAARTGLTVRTLRHYESIGLLEPVERTESGYRRYRSEDAQRLYAIVALRELGLSLAEVRAALEADPGLLQEMVERHVEEVRARRDALGELEGLLQRLRRELGNARALSLAELCEVVRLTAGTPSPRLLADEPAALHLLAQPLSGRILDRLQRGGPATAAELAGALGETTGAVERQLAQLTDEAFVERLAAEGTSTSWRIVLADLRLPKVGRTEESDRVARSWFEPGLRALERFVEREDAWAGSATLSNAQLTLTREELERLGAEYIALVRRYARPVEDAPPDARAATALLFAFPLDDA